jgi:hypothetical protein
MEAPHGSAEISSVLRGGSNKSATVRDVEGKSYERIAEITGTKVGMAESRPSRVR